MSKPHRGTIDGWTVEWNMVWGRAKGYDGPAERVVEGGPIRTSRIVKIDAREGGEVETLNSRYTLGKPATLALPAIDVNAIREVA